VSIEIYEGRRRIGCVDNSGYVRRGNTPGDIPIGEVSIMRGTMIYGTIYAPCPIGRMTVGTVDSSGKASGGPLGLNIRVEHGGLIYSGQNSVGRAEGIVTSRVAKESFCATQRTWCGMHIQLLADLLSIVWIVLQCRK